MPDYALLRDLDVGVSVDDFGTGYSNLAYLRYLPVHELKIAPVFVAGLDDVQDQQIVLTIINLAHALGLTVVAEGIATNTSARRLRDMGCDLGQGYCFGHPLPFKELVTHFAESS
jgi:EAL domain-containing protein (putative c-di-GMP-specific phosphodiesterase class I)